MKRTMALLSCCWGSLFITHFCFAELVAYDPIGYEGVGSSISGNDGGFGFLTPWAPGGFNASVSQNHRVGAGGLSYLDLQTSGNHITSSSTSSISGVTRRLSSPIGQSDTTTYLSFLVRPEGNLGQGQFNGFFGVVLSQSSGTEIFAGKPGGGNLDEFVLENRGGSNQVSTGIPIEVDETYLMVLKSEFTSGADTFSLYVNPTPGGPEPSSADAVSSASLSTVLGITLYSTGAFSSDEFRVGDSFADVVPVPEPGCRFIMLMGTLLSLRFRVNVRH